MIVEPKQADIDKEFLGRNFGSSSETPEGRRRLVADCILKRACGYSSGGTITMICRNLGLLTKQGNPRKHAKHWAYVHLMMPNAEARGAEPNGGASRSAAVFDNTATTEKD